MGNPKYELRIELAALNHLGIGLYSNTPAVVSEVVANSYDADATQVDIDIDPAGRTIVIQDDGWGMTEEDINRKYLTVPYDKRKNEPGPTPKGRKPMGRKGIGKLSLFSIADTIEVHSVKTDGNSKVIDRNGFVMDVNDIRKAIEAGGSYNPVAVDTNTIAITKGTKITLSNLRHGVDTTETFLRKRLARRFSIIGADQQFNVRVNSNPISVQDRDYFPKIEYIWYIGTDSKKYADLCENKKHACALPSVIDAQKGYCVTGWVGTFDEQKSIEKGNNTIVIMARGKLIHEDILKDIKEGGVFTKYLIGEIQADFLDLDEREDIATSDRQNLREDEERFQALKEFVQVNILKEVQKVWRDWRNTDAESRALENPKIKEWFGSLSKDNRKYARVLFGKIESFPIADRDTRHELYKYGVIAFETLAVKQNLSLLDSISTEGDFRVFSSIFHSLGELEEAHYYQIAKGRLAVLAKFEHIIDEDAKERVIQDHIFKNLWLLHPSWERASVDERIEQSVTKEFKKVVAKLSKEEQRGRFDIRYRTAAGKHIIVELKKYRRSPVDIYELLRQVEKYRGALRKCLEAVYPEEDHIIETICILGTKPSPSGNDRENRDMLAVKDARYLTYDELIQQTRDSYRDYLNAQKEIARIQNIINSM